MKIIEMLGKIRDEDVEVSLDGFWRLEELLMGEDCMFQGSSLKGIVSLHEVSNNSWVVLLKNGVYLCRVVSSCTDKSCMCNSTSVVDIDWDHMIPFRGEMYDKFKDTSWQANPYTAVDFYKEK